VDAAEEIIDKQTIIEPLLRRGMVDQACLT
jgi:hypothetical protein